MNISYISEQGNKSTSKNVNKENKNNIGTLRRTEGMGTMSEVTQGGGASKEVVHE